MIKRKSLIFLVIVLLMSGLPMSAFADEVQTIPIEKVIVEENQQVKENLPEPNISRDKALEIAKKSLKDLFSMSVDDPKFNYNIENRRDWSNPDLYVWQMNWNYNDAAEYVYAHVLLDAMTGKILEISKDGGNYGEPINSLTTLTRDEAEKKAEAFVEKVVPGLLKQTTLNDNGEEYYRIMQGGSQPIYYNFNYVRLYDGVKYDTNYINIGIDGATGNIRNFNYRWDELKDMPSKVGIISTEEAAKIMKDKIQMELIYLPIRDQYKYEAIPKNVKLTYRATQNFVNLIDAKTGTVLDWNGKTRDQNMKSASLTEKQINDILKNAKPIVKKEQITKERAQELALLILQDEVEGTVKINNINYVEGDSHWEAVGRKAWNIDFTVEKKALKSQDSEEKAMILPMMNGRIMIDALTEEILAFNNWDYNTPYGQDFDPAMSWEEAYTMAIDMVAKYHPDKIDQIKTDQVFYTYGEYVDGKEIPPMEYYFNFPRKVNGVLYEENSINVSFNNRTGKMQNLTCRWQEEVNFPAVGKALTNDEAKNVLLQYNGVEMAYYRFNLSTDYQNPKYETKLIYRLSPEKPQFNMYMMMDALSGKPIDYNGKEIPDYDMADFDAVIKDHWVERSAKLLAQQGILDPAAFKPEEAMTKMDVIKILVKARGMDYYHPMEKALDSKTDFSDVREDSDDYRYVQTAIRYGIIDNKDGAFNGSSTVTRQELAVLMVKTLKYDALAKASDIFTLDYDDKDVVSQELKGYVAITKGLELFREESSFRPKENATMAEVADMVYKSLAFMNR